MATAAAAMPSSTPRPPPPCPPLSALPLGWSKTAAEGNSMTQDYHKTRKTNSFQTEGRQGILCVDYVMVLVSAPFLP